MWEEALLDRRAHPRDDLLTAFVQELDADPYIELTLREMTVTVMGTPTARRDEPDADDGAPPGRRLGTRGQPGGTAMTVNLRGRARRPRRGGERGSPRAVRPAGPQRVEHHDFGGLDGFDRHVGISALRVVHHYLMGGWGLEDTREPGRCLAAA